MKDEKVIPWAGKPLRETCETVDFFALDTVYTDNVPGQDPKWAQQFKCLLVVSHPTLGVLWACGWLRKGSSSAWDRNLAVFSLQEWQEGHWAIVPDAGGPPVLVSVCRDAAGRSLVVGDRVGSVTAGRNPAAVVCEVVSATDFTVVGRILSVDQWGVATSSYAFRPQVGEVLRLQARRVFKLCGKESE
jgi:hypothetical protein